MNASSRSSRVISRRCGCDIFVSIIFLASSLSTQRGDNLRDPRGINGLRLSLAWILRRTNTIEYYAY